MNFGALASFILLNFAVFLFFFIREKKRNTFGDIVKYLICPWIGIAIPVYVFTGFETMTYIVGVVWLILGLIVGAVKSKGFKRSARGVQAPGGVAGESPRFARTGRFASSHRDRETLQHGNAVCANGVCRSPAAIAAGFLLYCG